MKCVACKKRNMRKSNYCKKCGRKFTQEEKENAKKEGFDIVLEKIKAVIDFFTLDFIFGNPIFKVLSVLVVLGIGIYMLVTMGWNLRVVESDVYDVKYNQNIDTYYVLLNTKEEEEIKSEVDIELYVPNRIFTLDLKYYDENGNLLEEEEHQKDDRYTLAVNTETNNYYIISDHQNEKDQVKIYVYYGE